MGEVRFLQMHCNPEMVGVSIEVGFIQGIEFRDALTPLSDITTFSAQGDSGTVDIEVTAIDPTQGIDALPEEPQRPEVIVGCAVSSNDAVAQLFDLGHGGKLPGPEDLMTIDSIIVEWIPLELNSPNENTISPTKVRPYLVANCGVDD